MAGGAVNTDQFEQYFKRADLDQDGRVSGSEAVSFFQASGLPKQVLAQIWTYTDQNRSGYLGRAEFYNYLKLVTVAQSKRDLTPDIVKAALYGPASAKIPPPQINLPASASPQSNLNVVGSAGNGIRGYSPQPGQVMSANHGMPGGGPNISNDSLTSGVHSQVPSTTTSSLLQNAKLNGSAATVSAPKDSNSRGVAGNGFASFGDAISSQASVPLTASAGGTQLPNKPFQSHQPTPNQNYQMHSNFRHNQQAPGGPGSTFPSVRPENFPSSQPWPKMSPTSIQKYTKVFMEVDTDKDGKITGEQARNLFLSWKLPREILKQVWDLSDEDNDSMLSLKEFCIALYLMERFREGRSLPKVLPSNIFEGQIPAASLWRPPPGGQQAHGMTAPRQVAPVTARPPRPVPVPIPEANEQQQHQHKQRKQTVPVLEKHLVDQLSTEEQKSLNSKFQEATEADKKVGELEKEILEAKQKIEFYRNKMQEIVLYKSRCDSRLNEITERVSGDKREVESLSKKYEEKYKQVGDVASKLTIEEATFRDIQDKKMELYRAIVKLEQEGKPDEIQARADRIQADLEEQVKTLNERCKMYGLRGKPTSLLELPFGWQSGIQEGAADWDENWDKFEDEGFTFVKELTLDVQNVIAPPKPKSQKSTFRDSATTIPATSDADKLSPENELNEKEKEKVKEKEKDSPPDSPASSKAPESPPTKIFHEKTQIENSDAQSVISGDKDFDEAGWGTFDTSYDSDAAWDFNATKPNKEENKNLFDDWGGLNPIRTEVPKKATFTFDSVPVTPSYGSPPPGDNLFQNRDLFSSTFADSVPSTPAYSYAGSPRQQPFTSVFADSVPSTPMYATNSPREENSFTNNFSRFDSFNSTPSDGGLFQPRDSFSRFDSFRSTTQDSEYDRTTLSRFDSMRSTAVDSDFGHSLFQHPNDSFSRFDSMRSSTESSDFNHGFPSFNDADPFGSSGPFKTTVESETPRRDSVDGWKAF